MLRWPAVGGVGIYIPLEKGRGREQQEIIGEELDMQEPDLLLQRHGLDIPPCYVHFEPVAHECQSLHNIVRHNKRRGVC